MRNHFLYFLHYFILQPKNIVWCWSRNHFSYVLYYFNLQPREHWCLLRKHFSYILYYFNLQPREHWCLLRKHFSYILYYFILHSREHCFMLTEKALKDNFEGYCMKNGLAARQCFILTVYDLFIYICTSLRQNGMLLVPPMHISWKRARPTISKDCKYHNLFWVVRPLAEYAAPGLTIKESAALERVQRRACKIILGNQYTSYDEALELCNLSTLFDRREQLCLDFFSSLIKLERFRSWVPPKKSTIHNKVLRNSNRLSIPRCKTSRCQKKPTCTHGQFVEQQWQVVCLNFV